MVGSGVPDAQQVLARLGRLGIRRHPLGDVHLWTGEYLSHGKICPAQNGAVSFSHITYVIRDLLLT